MKRQIVIPLIVVGTFVAGIGTARALRQSRPGPFQPYTVTYHVEDRAADGTLLGTQTEVKWQTSHGAMHETRDASHGAHYDAFGEPGRGVFIQKGEHLFSLSGPYAPINKTVEEWRATSGYVRDDVMAGVPVVMVKTQHGEGQGWSRVWLAPSLGGLLLKEEIYQPTVTTHKEVVTLDLSEPTRGTPHVPDLPVERALVPGAPHR